MSGPPNEKQDEDFVLPDGTKSALIIILANIASSLALAYIGHIISASDSVINIWIAYLIASIVCISMAAIIFLRVFPDYLKKVIDTKNSYRKEALSVFESVKTAAEATKNHIYDINACQLIISSHEKELILSDEILESGYCKLYHKIVLVNTHQAYTYKNYNFVILSEDAISEQDHYKIFKESDNICKPCTLTDDNFKIYKHIKFNGNGSSKKKSDQTPTNWECKITIPVGVPPKNGCRTLHIREDRCPSFKRLRGIPEKKEIVDSISTMIYYPTDKLEFKIKLEENSLEGYCIGRGGRADIEGDCEEFKILDRSNQWLDTFCNDMKTARPSINPKYSADKRTLTWTIHNPRVGFRYKLYFTLVKNT
ncbi:MAG TPA: hypothetical protein O0X51_01195 [Methanocorpusculum sp.]|nr:hypothetical protein [Methanocorpusculum sp.]HJK72608.1 hypothetical protein [Methanocorpusculum sp.]HJK83884.1 hypothetical protein [Methanocorpusculum sp.]